MTHLPKSASPSEPRRFAFEKWLNAKFLCTVGLNWSPIQGKYLNPENQAYWECWQARVDNPEVNQNQLKAAEPRRDEREAEYKKFWAELSRQGDPARIPNKVKVGFDAGWAARASAAPLNVEELAESLHIWYLEATRELKPESFNPNAQKSYADLTEEQRFIDRFIARKVLQHHFISLPQPSAGQTEGK